MEHQDDIATAEENAQMDLAIAGGVTTIPVEARRNTYGLLSELPTRVLLAMKEDLRLGFTETTCWCRPESQTTSRIYEANAEQVRAALAARPHVMNKVEAKLMRKLMSQNKMTEAQIRSVPKFKTLLAEASGNLAKVSKHQFELYQRQRPGQMLTGTRRLSVKK